MEKNNGYKFLKLELSNFKNLDQKIIDIGGQSFIVIGKNGAGKSSLIQALCSPLDSKIIPTKPVKEGEEKAQVQVTIGNDDKKYILTLYFSEKNQKGRLTIENEKGESVKSPATTIKSLLGQVSFDPMRWLYAKKDERLKTIKRITGCEKELDIIDLAITEHKNRKKFKKERVEELEAILKNNQFTQEEREKYSSPLDIVPIQEELSKVSANQEKWDEISRKTKGFADKVNTCEENIMQAHVDIQSAEDEIQRLTNLIATKKEFISKERISQEEAKTHNDSGKAWLEKVQRPSSVEINERLTEATKHNERHSQMGVLMEQQKEMIKLKQEVSTIDTTIGSEEKKKAEKIASSQFPIPGFSFDDNDIYFDGIPLEKGGINTAKAWEICVDIEAALHPNLRTIFLHDASLFDKETLHRIIAKAEERGFQVICEVVDPDGGELQVRFTETYLQ